MQKTVLQQLAIPDSSDALKYFESGHEDKVPLVLIPQERSCCSCFLQVPSGPFCIWQQWGRDLAPNNLASPGLHPALACNRIAYCVNRQAITYNAPVKSCPTADNVMVDCDLTLVFNIGPEPVEVKKFVYRLGAVRFDDFLYAAVEEGIRHLIRTCLHTEVYELRGGSDVRVVTTLKELNKKFNPFGVHFSRAAITDVRLNPDLQACLQETTEFSSKIKEHVKKHKHEMDEIEYARKQAIKEREQIYSRQIQDLTAHRTRVEIDRGKDKLTEISKAEVALTGSREKASVAKVRALSQLEVSTTQGMQRKEAELAKANTRIAEMKIAVDQETATAIFEAEQELVAARNLAESIRLEAAAEERAQAALKTKREHDLRMAKSEVHQMMAMNNKIVITGNTGDKIISEMLTETLGKITV